MSYAGAIIAAGAAQRTWNRLGAGTPLEPRMRHPFPWWLLVSLLIMAFCLTVGTLMFLEALQP